MTTELSKQSQGITDFANGTTNPTSRLVKIVAINAGAQKANVAPACQRPFVENGKFSICRHCPYRTPPKSVQEKPVFVTRLKD